jgi:drug/metabolite transporter (DMT)-like permease
MNEVSASRQVSQPAEPDRTRPPQGGRLPPGEGAAHGYSALAMVLIATTFPVGDLITDAIDPAVLQSIRFVVAALIFAPFVALRVGLPLPSARDLLRYGAIAAAMDVFFWAMYEGLRTTDSLNTAVLSCTIPGFTALFSAALLRERVGWHRYLALLLGLLGSLWVIFRGDPARLVALEFHFGDALFLGGCVSMGLYATLVRYLHRGEPVMRMSLWIMVMAGVLFLLAANLKLASTDYGALALGVWGGAIWLAIGPTVCTFFLIQSSTIAIGATRVQTYSYSIPVFVILLDWGLGRGLPPVMTLPGVVIVLLASLVIQRGAIGIAAARGRE